MQESHTTPMESILGTIIERRYLLREVIGEGGFAEVFEASDTKLGRKVALKILKPHPNPAQRELAHRRFFREAKLAAQINHPDIVTIFDYGQTLEERPFIVLEHLQGRPLSRLLWHDGPMDPVRAYNLFMKVVHAIAAAHEQGVIHRDLKPSNLMLIYEDTRLESIKVLDFGIALYFEDSLTRLTSTGQFLGTPEYLAPEYIGERNITPALDVYQLALIFIEMLTGQPLVSFSEPLQCMFAHYNGYVKVPNYLMQSDIGLVLERALSAKPTQRFHNAGSFFRALDELDPHTIPTIPEQATPEELALTRDWDSSEVDQFSEVFEHQLSKLQALDNTASIDPVSDVPYRPYHATEPAPAPPEDTAHSPKLLRWVGLLGVLLIVGVGTAALLIEQDASRPPPPLEPSVATIAPPEQQPRQPHEVRINVQPEHATILEGEDALGTGSAGLVLSRDTGAVRRIEIKADGFITHSQEISRDSPAQLDIVLDPTPSRPNTPDEPPVIAKKTQSPSHKTTDKSKPSPKPKPATQDEPPTKQPETVDSPTKEEPDKEDKSPEVIFKPFDKITPGLE